MTHLTAASLLVLFSYAPTATGHATGQLYCREGPLSPHNTEFSTDPPPFSMTLTAMDGSALTSYIPGATQTWKLTSTTQYNFGFIAAAFSGSQSDIGIEFIASPRVGVLSPVDSSTQNMLDDGTNDCTMGLTHTLNNSKSSVSGSFAAPAAGTGQITFFAIVVIGEFLQPYRVYATFDEGTAPSSTSSPTLSASGTSAATVSPVPTVTPTKTNPSKGPTPTKTPTKTPPVTKSSTKTPPPTKSSTKTATKTKTSSKSLPPSKTCTKTATQTHSSSAKPKTT